MPHPRHRRRNRTFSVEWTRSDVSRRSREPATALQPPLPIDREFRGCSRRQSQVEVKWRDGLGDGLGDRTSPQSHIILCSTLKKYTVESCRPEQSKDPLY